jgi:hypothetical protein
MLLIASLWLAWSLSLATAEEGTEADLRDWPPLPDSIEILPAGASTMSSQCPFNDGSIMLLTVGERWRLGGGGGWMLPPGDVVLHRADNGRTWQVVGWHDHAADRDEIVPMSGAAQADPSGGFRIELDRPWPSTMGSPRIGHYRIQEVATDLRCVVWNAPHPGGVQSTVADRARLVRNLLGLEDSLPVDTPRSHDCEGRVVEGWCIMVDGEVRIDGLARIQSGNLVGSLVELRNDRERWLFTDPAAIRLPRMLQVVVTSTDVAWRDHLLAIAPHSRVRLVLVQQW